MLLPTIVVGYDGSANAHSALEAAVDILAADGVIHVVTAFDKPTDKEMDAILEALPDEFRPGYDPLYGPRGYLEHAEAYLDRCEVNHRSHIADEHPASAILRVADDVGADLIVVGSRGLGRARRILRGSVSSQIASHATTSFMVIQDQALDSGAAA